MPENIKEYDAETYTLDRELTLRNRKRIRQNRNLVYWFKCLFREQLRAVDIEKSRVLEIGSGASLLKESYPNVLTSDVMDVDHVDFIFDCHELAGVSEIPDASLDVILMTNVLHHVRDPVLFLRSALTKLNSSGRIIMTEPYFSVLSSIVFKYFHHEPVDMSIKEPVLDTVRGPLSSANIALPYLVFFTEKWKDRFDELYEMNRDSIGYFSSMSYFLTGGISRRFPIPNRVYQWIFRLDRTLADLFPRLLASFFILELQRKDKAG